LGDGPANRYAELVLDERRRDEVSSAVDKVWVALKHVPSLHGIASMKLVGRSVEFVGSGLRDDVDLPAGCLAELRGVVIDLDLELLDRIDVRPENDAVVPGIGIGYAVKLVGIVLVAVSVHADSAAPAAVPTCRLAGIDTGHERCQLEKVPAV
jgi:hypothetical protein